MPYSASEALVSVTLPCIQRMAGRRLSEAVTDRAERLSGLNAMEGSLCHPGKARPGPGGGDPPAIR